jgi:hypothetical protein
VALHKLPWRAVVFVLFLISRIVLLSSDVPGSTLLAVNVTYGFEVQRAAALGVSFYHLHAVNRADDEPNSPEAERQVEYPPLAIAWMCLPNLFLEPLPKTGLAPDSLSEAAKQANRIAMFVVDLVVFALLVWIGAGAASLATYSAAGLLLFPLLYDRMDLLLGLFLVAAVAAVMRKLPAWVCLAVLAVAINFKLTPLVLVPVFVLGTLSADEIASWKAIARRAAVLALLTAGLFLPFLARDGAPALGFLQYHAARGLQLESLWSTLPLTLTAWFQIPTTVMMRFGAAEIQSNTTGALLALSSLAMALVIPAVAFIFWKMLRARGSASPALLINCSVVFLLAAVLTSKVLSPQYLLWIAPLIALWKGRRPWLVWSVFLATCVLTTLCFPFGYDRLVSSILHAGTLPLGTRLIGIAPLIFRNLLLVALTVLCWRDRVPVQQAESIPAAATPRPRASKRTRSR